MELVLGIDDAGRGPVIGPMVLAGCLLNEEGERELRKAGVRDSKDITPKKREFLAEKIQKNANTYEIILSHPREIDGNSQGNESNLNKLEAQKAADIINRMNKDSKKIRVILDCPSVSLEKWKQDLMKRIENLSNLEIVCEHKADRNHIPVAAASILAKSTREKEMDKLKEMYGKEIGSGYCSDRNTMEFLKRNAKKHQNTGLFRETWVSWKIAFKEQDQKKLF